MSRYDYFIAGRWRNRDAILKVVEAVRADGKTAYCFLENPYEGDGLQIHENADPEKVMTDFESLDDWQTNPTVRKIYEADMQALKDSAGFILVLPAGLSGHMELGAAYGMGKKCYAIGTAEKPETLYLMLDGIYSSVDELIKATGGVLV